MIKKLRMLIMTALITAMLPVSMICAHADNDITISIDELESAAGESVSVPIRIANNTGVCGATITIDYDENLVLTGVDKGEALETLVMTKPGRLTDNPVRIMWDGLEEDNTNGIIAVLTFTAPSEPGNYNIQVSYDDGDIVNGDLIPLNVTTQNGGIKVGAETVTDQPMLSVGNAEVKSNEEISIPLTLSGNTGICGATISIEYGSGLTLTGIDKGDALESLVMTKPGRFTDNPVRIMWDGLEEDRSNGVIAFLTFKAPSEPGIYDIKVSYEDGDIVNGDLSPVNVKVENGQIKVLSDETEEIAAENIGVFYADKDYEGASKAATAFKASLNGSSGVMSVIVSSSDGEVRTFNSVTTITDANVVLGIIVSGLDDAEATCKITVK